MTSSKVKTRTGDDWAAILGPNELFSKWRRCLGERITEGFSWSNPGVEKLT